MKLITWNVNGLRAVLQKNFFHWFRAANPDLLCLQETKAQDDVLPPEVKAVPGYHVSYCAGERKGYSGVSTWSRTEPKAVKPGFGLDPRFDAEGRILHHDFGAFHLLNIYFPNGGEENRRVPFKLEFYEACQRYCQALVDHGGHLILCGDVNTAHNEIDLARPKENEDSTGFLPAERAWLDRFTAAGFIDVFRRLYPDTVAYSWWSYRGGARRRNVGWRLDYFFVSPELWDRVRDCQLHAGVMGSDHCPVSLEIDL